MTLSVAIAIITAAVRACRFMQAFYPQIHTD
jgi:hypothetical protein